MLRQFFVSTGSFVTLALCTAQAYAQASPFPIHSHIPIAPTPVVVGGQQHLVYELKLDNLSGLSYELSVLEVQSSQSRKTLARYEGEQLNKLILNFGAPPEKANSFTPGSQLMTYLDVKLELGQAIPDGVQHLLLFKYKKADGSEHSMQLTTDPIHINRNAVLRLHPPLKGDNWVAYDILNPEADSHRRTLQPVNGRAYNNQRFAIDWVKLGPDGKAYHGAVDKNSNWFGFGENVYAVANGTVVAASDQQVDNTPPNTPPVALEGLAGNWIILDLGNSKYAAYAHLQHGSNRVKVGDKVKAGQVIAKLGNSGQSTGPHLHFQIANSKDFIASEGLPYVFTQFYQQGVLDYPDKLETGEVTWKPSSHSQSKENELPVNFGVIRFPR